ncbi:MAG TPA: ribonuclease III domain-containing protein [Methylomirabilota bacterium]|nr:ribonuclease III domain-containing protein [Methylomirabilota bacterium]
MTATDPLAAFEDRLNHRFLDPGLLRQALTHPSWAHEHPPARHNESLAFLGDAVLGLVVADLLRAAAPEEEVGSLTRRRAEVVSGRALAEWARRLDLPAAIRLGRGEDQSGGRNRESVLATALEAVFGALYLDAGLDPVRALVRGQAPLS